MGDVTGIAWTQKTWNPWHGCHKISPGCKFCYMFTEKRRSFSRAVGFPASLMNQSDHEHIIAATARHTYQILTKRHERMLEHMPDQTACKRLVGRQCGGPQARSAAD